jgi:hypothetical protein
MRIAVALVSSAFLAATPAGTQAQTFGRVTAYNADSLRTYNADGGRRSPGTPASQLPNPPIAIVDIQPGGRIGIVNRGNERIYVRGMDVEFELNDAGRELAGCRPVVSNNRAAGTVVAGTRAGGGSSTDCIAGGGR